MSEFSRWFFANSTVLMWPVIAMGLFLCTYLGAIARTFTAPKKQIDALSSLPLEDQEKHQ